MKRRHSSIVAGCITLLIATGAASASPTPFGFNDSFTAASTDLVRADNELKAAKTTLVYAEDRLAKRTAERDTAKTARDLAAAQESQAHQDYDDAVVAEQRAHSTYQQKKARAKELRDSPLTTPSQQRQADQEEQQAKTAYDQAVVVTAQRKDEWDAKKSDLSTEEAALTGKQAAMDEASQMVSEAQATIDQKASASAAAEAAHRAALGTALDQTTAAGAQVNRFTIDWSQVERLPGAYDFGYSDIAYELMEARGIEPLILVTGSPCWARLQTPCGSTFTQGGEQVEYRTVAPDAEHLASWQALNREIATRYPTAVGVEVWNEPNLKLLWGPDPEGASYKELFFAAAKGVAQVDPRMPMIFGGLSPETRVPGMPWARFLKSAYQSGVGKEVDVLGLHPYSRQDESPSKQVAIASKLRKRFDHKSKLWITEYGASAKSSKRSQARQAKALVKSSKSFKKQGVGLALVHRLRFAQNPNAWERGLSVLNPNGSPKPAYCALAKLHNKRPAACS